MNKYLTIDKVLLWLFKTPTLLKCVVKVTPYLISTFLLIILMEQKRKKNLTYYNELIILFFK